MLNPRKVRREGRGRARKSSIEVLLEQQEKTLALRIGTTDVPYRVRYSERAGRRRIVVRSGEVEVVAPVDTQIEGPRGIKEFVWSKRAWVFNALQHYLSSNGSAPIQRYESGAKLLYRGRRLMLKLHASNVRDVRIKCRSRFHVQVPRKLAKADRERHIALAFDIWLRDRALKDATRLTGRYARKLGVEPRGVQLGKQKMMWGTCGKDRIIRIHWQLIQAPAAAMEYVVAHEACHLKYRHHDPIFWRTLGGIMPDWRERKVLLEEWEREIGRESMRLG